MATDSTPVPDELFDRFADIVRRILDVPVALVSIVEPDRQVFPGAVGLSEPWQSQRETPLSHSFCQYVVADEAPMAIDDARVDPRLKGNLAIEDLDVIAYAGHPLRDHDGTVIGSLCAIDSHPRAWSASELSMLESLAVLCSTELSLRESRRRLTHVVQVATALAERSRVLLDLSERISDTVSTADIAATLQDVAAKNLGCNHAGIWLLDAVSGDLRHVSHPSQFWMQAEDRSHLPADDSNPIGAAFIANGATLYADRAAQDALFPLMASAPRPGDGQARAMMPLMVAGKPVGVLAMLWEQPRDFDEQDRLGIAALTSYTSQAVHRAQLLAERTSVASTLQDALLSELPVVADLDLAARYRAAAAHDEVGGDWYDAVVMPSGAVGLMIGDVSGHDITAAATMGGLSNMLRALAWAIDDAPSANVGRLDQACRDMGLRAYATLIFARIEQGADAAGSGARTLRWTNAGHPAPILLGPDGSCVALDDRAPADIMLGVDPGAARRDQTVKIAVGSTLILYTDGLVETRHSDLDAGQARLVEAISRHHAKSPGDLLDAVLDDLVGATPPDDVAALAVRFKQP